MSDFNFDLWLSEGGVLALIFVIFHIFAKAKETIGRDTP